MKQLARLFVFSLVVCTCTVVAQEQQPTSQPSPEELEKQKEEWTKNAYRILDQVVDESQTLRLADNRVRIQIYAADLLWDRDQARARSLFIMAGDAVAEMMRSGENTTPRPGPPNQPRRPAQIRQELVLAAARHDAPLAYQLLATTKPPVATPNTDVLRQNRPQSPVNPEEALEQNLLAAVAQLDPKLAAQNADQLLEKGQFPYSISDVITQLRRQDQEAATKLADKTVKRLQSSNVLSNNQASMLAFRLLSPGPRNASTATAETATPSQARAAILDQSAYVDLLGSLIDSAMKATPSAQNTPRPANLPRAAGGGPNARAMATNQTQPTDAQLEQANAGRMLVMLQQLLPQIDQNLPARSQAVRQKLTEMGVGDNNRPLGPALSALNGGGTNVTADALMQTAASAPAQMQARLYQQAAYKAIDEGDTERARQIATDHLQGRQRDVVMQRIDFRNLANSDGVRMDDVRQKLASLQSDGDRVVFLIQLATDVQSKNPKLQRQLLEEARQLTNKRATSYESFEQQLQVARAFASVDAGKTFEIIDSGISHLNELLSAAAVLNGFETNVFRDGELPLQGGSGLTMMVTRYGQELAFLAKTDFTRSETLAGRFQLPESRIIAKLAIAQGLLGVRSDFQGNAGFRLTQSSSNSTPRP